MEKTSVNAQISSTPTTPRPDPRALKILAKSIFKELRAQGYTPQQVLSLATEVISLVTSDIAHDSDTTPR